jgi:hypothetical protein
MGGTTILHEVSDVLWIADKPRVEFRGKTEITTWRLHRIGQLTVAARPGGVTAFDDHVALAGMSLEYRAFQHEYSLIPPEHLIKPISDELAAAFRRADLWSLRVLPFKASLLGFFATCGLALVAVIVLGQERAPVNTPWLLLSAVWLISSLIAAVILYRLWLRRLFQGYEAGEKTHVCPLLLSKRLLHSAVNAGQFDTVLLIEDISLTKSPPDIGFRNPSTTLGSDGQEGTHIGLRHPVVKIMPHHAIKECLAEQLGTEFVLRDWCWSIPRVASRFRRPVPPAS